MLNTKNADSYPLKLKKIIEQDIIRHRPDGINM